MLAFILTDGQIERFFWARPVSTAVLISAFIAVFILTIFLYRRRQGLPFGLRMVLAFFRLLALSFIVAALFEPSVTIEKTYTEKRRLPVLVDVSKGKANFKLHAILARTNIKGAAPKKNSGNTKLKPRSQQNTRMKLPFRVLALRENENLID